MGNLSASKWLPAGCDPYDTAQRITKTNRGAGMAEKPLTNVPELLVLIQYEAPAAGLTRKEVHSCFVPKKPEDKKKLSRALNSAIRRALRSGLLEYTVAYEDAECRFVSARNCVRARL